MAHRFTTPLILTLSLACFGVGCSDDGGSTDTETGSSGTGDGDGDPAGDGDGDATGDGDGDTPGDGDGDATGDGDGDTPGDGDGDAPGDGDGDTPGDGDGDATGDGDGDAGCQVWEIEYALTDSEFEISGTPFGAGDQVNIVAEPYDEDDHVGPGSFVLRFRDVNGEPAEMAWMVSYDMTLNFTINGVTTIETELQNEAGPEECGLTNAMFGGNQVVWDPLGIPDHHSMGQITCFGNLCGLGGFENGVPSPVDETDEQPLEPFDFNDDFSGFNMNTVVVQQDNNSTTTWSYTGTQISRQLVAAPDCLCQ